MVFVDTPDDFVIDACEHIDDHALRSAPLVDANLARGHAIAMTLPALPLMTLPADRLRQFNVAYEATGVAVGFTGLRIDIAPR